MKIVVKPWGKEEWIELNDKYCYKRIYINKGYKTSYQYHEFKTETNYIISGVAEVWLEDENGIVNKNMMVQGEFFNVTPTRKHRVIALTDIILQEVSTPEVDDVIRLEDDTNRGDGKILSEHFNPAVLILAAGTGSRLGGLTEKINKIMLPINNIPLISYIITKFPQHYNFIIAIGHKGDIIKEYCKAKYPFYNFTFVDVENYEGDGTGPGYSALKCENYLQRPFYFITADCLIESEIPAIDCNWLGSSSLKNSTLNKKNYSTMDIIDDNIIKLNNKSENGGEFSFIGLAGILDYQNFWEQLKSNIKNGEIISAFENPSTYSSLKHKEFIWYDAGCIEGLDEIREHFNEKPLSLKKDNGEITYKDNSQFIKFIPNNEIISNKEKRGKILSKITPPNQFYGNYFMMYDWVNGKTLYEWDNLKIFRKFLIFFKKVIQNRYVGNNEDLNKFYIDKTDKRMNMFLDEYGTSYYTQKYRINGELCESMESLLKTKINYTIFNNNPFYNFFHGDLQFDNIIYNDKTDDFKYIDWRDSFGSDTNGGDIYYDLAKLYGGLIIPYNMMKNIDNLEFFEENDNITYNYKISESLTEFKMIYEQWLFENGFNLIKIKTITALIFLNMSPLHETKFNKFLWFKSNELLNENL